eukprot:6699867-Karenia_brevis.AAC.1
MNNRADELAKNALYFPGHHRNILDQITKNYVATIMVQTHLIRVVAYKFRVPIPAGWMVADEVVEVQDAQQQTAGAAPVMNPLENAILRRRELIPNYAWDNWQ